MCLKHISPKLFYIQNIPQKILMFSSKRHVFIARIGFELCISDWCLASTQTHTPKLSTYTSICVCAKEFGNGFSMRTLFLRSLALIHFSLWFSFLLARVSGTTTITKSMTTIAATADKMWYNSCPLFMCGFLHNKFILITLSINICETLTKKCVFFNYYNVWCVADFFFHFLNSIKYMNEKVTCTSSSTKQNWIYFRPKPRISCQFEPECQTIYNRLCELRWVCWWANMRYDNI